MYNFIMSSSFQTSEDLCCRFVDLGFNGFNLCNELALEIWEGFFKDSIEWLLELKHLFSVECRLVLNPCRFEGPLARFVVGGFNVMSSLSEFLESSMNLQCNVGVISDTLVTTMLRDDLI